MNRWCGFKCVHVACCLCNVAIVTACGLLLLLPVNVPPSPHRKNCLPADGDVIVEQQPAKQRVNESDSD